MLERESQEGSKVRSGKKNKKEENQVDIGEKRDQKITRLGWYQGWENLDAWVNARIIEP